MTDQELLELAASAAGLYYWIDGDAFLTHGDTPGGSREWNPLTEDGDAFRLAVKCGIGVLYADFSGEAEARWDRGHFRLTEYGPDDPCAATRRAIVRAAAEIGKVVQ